MKSLLLALFFTTLSLLELHAQCCDYTLVLVTRFGSEWNGGAVDLRLNGGSLGTYTADGPYLEVTFEACEGDEIELEYTPGSSEFAKLYRLFDGAGFLVFSDGPSPDTGISFTGTANCSTNSQAGEVPCMAIPLDTVACTVTDNTGFISSGFSPSCNGYTDGDAWFELTVPQSGNIHLASHDIGGAANTSMALWERSTCHVLERLFCNDDGPGMAEITQYNLEPFSSLLVQVWTDEDEQGAFELCYEDLGPVVLESSELAIVHIDVDGEDIPNEPKIDGTARMIFNGPDLLNHVTDSANVYAGHIGIERRGASSAFYPQKPYGLETRDAFGENLNVSLFGMPAENDWVLLSNFNDRSLMRNMLAMDLFTQMGHYAPRMTLCELVIDTSYRGIYTFGEKLKRDAGRVNIATLNPDENSGEWSDYSHGFCWSCSLESSFNW